MLAKRLKDPYPILLLLLLTSCVPSRQFASVTYNCNFSKAGSLSAHLKPSNRFVPLIMAHQGGTEDGYPGNCMATFENTYQNVPCVMLEFDIRMTADSMLVLSHDNELEKRTNGTGLLNQQPWKDVKQLRLKDDKGLLTKNKIPSFKEVLDWSKDKNLILIVDKKPETDLVKTIRMLKENNALQKSVVICYSLEEAKTVYALEPTLMIAVGFNSWEHITNVEKSGLPLENLVALTPKEIQAESFYMKVHSMKIITSLGTNGNIDTLNTEISAPLYNKIWESGADIICTDQPIFVHSLFQK
jgi:glycerophosphoryl diester phosphodiesterase